MDAAFGSLRSGPGVVMWVVYLYMFIKVFQQMLAVLRYLTKRN